MGKGCLPSRYILIENSHNHVNFCKNNFPIYKVGTLSSGDEYYRIHQTTSCRPPVSRGCQGPSIVTIQKSRPGLAQLLRVLHGVRPNFSHDQHLLTITIILIHILLRELRELSHLLRPMKFALAPKQSDFTGLQCRTVGGQWNQQRFLMEFALLGL